MAKTNPKRFFELPFVVDPPNFEKPDLGLGRVALRGQGYNYEMDVNLIDTPDSRLIRSGVVLAHRVIDGKPEWYLDAPAWGPWLPTSKSEPTTSGPDEVPAQYSRLVRPFRRQSALGQVAEIHSERVEYLLRTPEGERLGKLRDEKVTIKRSGTVASRFREVTLIPDTHMTSDQRSFIGASLESVGGKPVDEFPSFVQRLGAPSTGVTDIPEAEDFDDDMTLEGYISAILTSRLRYLVRADLAVRSGSVNDVSGVMLQLRGLLEDISAFASFFDPDWREGFEAMINSILELGPRPMGIDSLGEGYFAVLDTLVSAAKAPRISHSASKHAGTVLLKRIEQCLSDVMKKCGTVLPQSLDQRWIGTEQAVSQCWCLISVSKPLLGDKYRRLRKRLRKIQKALKPTLPIKMEPLDEEVRAMEPLEAYQLGRKFQARKDDIRISRMEFCDSWPRQEEKLKEILE